MSKYTITIREYYGKDFSFENIHADLFKNVYYNFFDADLKKELEIDFIKHYYNREIGTETFDAFKYYLSIEYSHTAEKYNLLFKELYRLTADSTEQLFGSGRTERFEQDNTETLNTKVKNTYDNKVNNTGTNESNSTARIDNTPQVPYTSGNYANNITTGTGTDTTNNETKKTGSDTQENTGTNTNKILYTRTVTGNAVNDHNYSLLLEFKEKFNSLSESMMQELNHLFLGIF